MSTETASNAPAAAETAPAQTQELIEIADFAKVDLRTARIEHAEALPKSKKLLKLQIDLGELGKRQILSGIAQFYAPEALIGKTIVVVANLKPATMMGEQSQGMLLAASTDGVPPDAVLALLQPNCDIPPGTRVR